MDRPEFPDSTEEIETLVDGRFTIVRRIGVGGMGEVYLATDVRHARPVALKVIGRQNTGTVTAQRFLREISIVAKLSHPNIVPLFDSGQVGSLLYYVMPFVEGPSLRARLKSEVQLSLEEALAITLQVADALQYAHEHGVVHRDIKPDNILLDSGHALVADFGIAKALRDSGIEQVTSPREAVGTLAYMSPEQAGAATNVDGRSDTYSLALLLYEMLAGDLPFQGATPEGIFARKAIGRYSPLRDVRRTVPEYVDSAIARALQPVPADRFSSVSDFASALRDPKSVSKQLRSRRLSWIITTALILAAILAGTAFWIRRSPQSSTPLAGLGRIVVSPLENRTGSPSLDMVGLMAEDWLTEGLQQTGLVEVVPIPAAVQASRYVGSKAKNIVRDPSQALAAETGAQTVVSGAIYRQGGNLLFRVSVADHGGSRLIGTLVDINGPLENPVQGVQELRNRLMGWLAIRYDDRVKIASPEGHRPPTYDAYRAFSEGMARYVAVDNKGAFPLFLKAFEIDTSFTVSLLYASISLTNVGAWARADSLLQVVNDRREGLSSYNQAWLDYRMAFVHGNREAALSAIREAARDAPGSKAAYNHAVEAFLSGHLNEALRAIKALPPNLGAMRGFAPYWDIYGAIQHALGLYDQEYSTGLTAQKMYPDRLTRFTPIARALIARGQIAEVDSIVREAERLPTDPVGWDFGHLLSEVAKEAGSHGQLDVSVRYYEQLYKWLTAADRGPSTKWRTVEALYALGRWNQAAKILASLRDVDEASLQYLGMQGLIYSRTGRHRMAEFVSDSLARQRTAYQFGASSLYRARIAAALGEPYIAVARLREALSEGRSYDLELHRDIDFKSLSGYPPFEQLKKGKD